MNKIEGIVKKRKNWEKNIYFLYILLLVIISNNVFYRVVIIVIIIILTLTRCYVKVNK